MVSNLVTNSLWGDTAASAIPLYWVNVYVPDLRLGVWKCQFRGVRLKGCRWQFSLNGAGRLFVLPAYTMGLLLY